jgi:prophage regulatory protein
MSQREIDRRKFQSQASKLHKQQTDFLLRRREVELQTALSRASIYRLILAGLFPRPVSLGTGSVRWRQSDITAWQSNLSKTA